MKAMGIIFSNIYDSALGQLTGERTVASLPFGGRYRQVDFVLSNFSNSGIYNIGIITKYNYRSLMDHLGSCADWDLNRKNEGVVVLPPFAQGGTGIYKGKLEALHSAIHFIDNPKYEYVVVCDSTVLCNINFRKAIKDHVASGCDVTILATKGKKEDTKHPLVLKTNTRKKVTEILLDTTADHGNYVGMGMFIFKRDMLVKALEESYSKGFVHLERDFLQRAFREGKLSLSVFAVDGVVLRNQDIKSYFANNMALLDKKVRDGLFLKDAPIYTKVRDEAPTYYFKGSEVSGCMIADGCVLKGRAEKSIIFRGVTLEEGSMISNSIVMQGSKIGKGAYLYCAILDKNVTVKDGAVLQGTPEHPVIIKKGETV